MPGAITMDGAVPAVTPATASDSAVATGRGTATQATITIAMAAMSVASILAAGIGALQSDVTDGVVTLHSQVHHGRL